MKKLVRSALQEDIQDGDQSTLACIDAAAEGKAVLKIKEPGILAGMALAQYVFSLQQPDAVFHPYKKDGDAMQAGEIAFEVEAKAAIILQ